MTGMVIYLVVRFLLRPTGIAWIDFHLSDFLSVPVIAGITTSLMQLWRGKKFQLSTGQTIFIAFYLSVVFEFVLPEKNIRYTGDLVDIICYFLGAIFWIIVTKKFLK